MCYCEHCRTNFRAATGHELPRTDDPQDPARRAYIVWHQQRLFELWRLWDAEVRKINPDSLRHPERRRRRDQPARHEDHRRARPDAVRRPPGAERPDAPVGQRQDRQGVPRRDGRQARSAASSAWASRRRYRWKDSVQSEAEIRIWFADGVANGLRPWFTKFAGMLHDRRWLERRRGPLPLASRASSGTCGTRRRSPGSAWSTRSRRPGSTAARGEGEGRGPRAGLVPGAHRGPHPLRDGPRPAPRRRPTSPGSRRSSCRTSPPCPTSSAGSSARSSSAAAASWRPTRRRSTTSGARGATDFGLADLFGVSFRRPRRRADAERLPAARGRSPHRPRHPLLDGLDDAPRIIHGTWRLDVTPKVAVRRTRR